MLLWTKAVFMEPCGSQRSLGCGIAGFGSSLGAFRACPDAAQPSGWFWPSTDSGLAFFFFSCSFLHAFVACLTAEVAAEKTLEEEIAAEIEAEAEDDDVGLTAVDEEDDHGHILTAMPSPAAMVDVAYVMPNRKDDDGMLCYGCGLRAFIFVLLAVGMVHHVGASCLLDAVDVY